MVVSAKINYEVFLNETFAVDSAAVIFQACLIVSYLSCSPWEEDEQRVKREE